MILFSWIPFREGERFVRKVEEICNRLSIHPDAMMAVLWIESEFERAALNPMSGAYGLNQCLPSTLRGMGLNKAMVSRMSGTQQLERVVYQYFKPYAGRMIRPIDVYLANFYPVAIGKNDSFVIAREGQNAYRYNSIIDTGYGDNDGRLEIFDVRHYLNSRLWRAVKIHRKNPKYRNLIPPCYEPYIF